MTEEQIKGLEEGLDYYIKYDGQWLNYPHYLYESDFFDSRETLLGIRVDHIDEAIPIPDPDRLKQLYAAEKELRRVRDVVKAAIEQADEKHTDVHTKLGVLYNDLWGLLPKPESGASNGKQMSREVESAA